MRTTSAGSVNVPVQLNAELMIRRAANLPRGISQAHPIFAAHAMNSELWDGEGRRYIDFCGGIAVVNTGHCHPKIMQAAAAQLEHFTHTCFQVVAYETYVRLAERLNALAPGSAPKKTFFMTTGAEAIENAIKIARAYTKRSGIIAFAGAFHGRTMLALALTGKVDPYKSGFGPFPGEIFHAPYPCEVHGVTVAQALAGIEGLFKTDIQPERVAAVIVEPVLGEGGYYPAPAEFPLRLQELCTRHGILMIADEIQTGIGRTGKMFAVEHYGVMPDIITLAKGLGGGLPISAVIGRAEVMDAADPGGLGGTFAGNPISCAAALAVLDVIEEEELLERSERLGARMKARMQEIARRYPAIGEVRGLGLMLALEFFHDRERREPAPDLAKALVAEAEKQGLLLLSCGTYGNVVRVMAPLTVPDAIVDEALDIFERSLGATIRAT
jgi:4-aminobutyrate aminotransferase/4-aminobutyrate aminotransferase/(S)-3-amino-2-methylpropionate transaminase